MAGGSRNTRSTQNNEEEELPEEEELSDEVYEVYEGVTAYLAADKRLAAERNISKSIREALGTEDAKYNGQRKDFRKFYEAWGFIHLASWLLDAARRLLSQTSSHLKTGASVRALSTDYGCGYATPNTFLNSFVVWCARRLHKP
ncbi:hypothetical protein NFJ02_12g08760 [Pycnococcus provasolii]